MYHQHTLPLPSMRPCALAFHFLFFLSVLPLFAAETLVSPDGAVEAVFDLRDGAPVYGLTYKGSGVLAASGLGLNLKEPFSGGFAMTDVARAQSATAWKPVWGERASIPGRFNSLTVTLKETDPRGQQLVVELRAYNEGLAFRYRLPFAAADVAWQVESEATEFRFGTDSAAFAIKNTEDTFPQDPVPLADLPKSSMAPFTVRLPGGKYASVLEAFVVSYPRCRIGTREGGAVGIDLQGKAEGRGAFTTPWRVILLGDNEARLIENEHLVQTLNPPCAIPDTSWIKPGLTVSDHGNCLLQMADLKRVIDVAHTNGFRYLQLDWGWYGTEWTWTDADRKKFLEVNPSWSDDLSWVTNTYADPYTVAKGRVPYRPDWKSSTTVDLDMPELVRYARERNMSVCLYMHGDVLRAHDMDKLFATYQSWGLAGLKPGFVRYGNAEQTDWIRKMVEAAARRNLWLCVHDAHVPDGLARTYPNLMITEGGGGQEGNHPVRQDVLLPFTRGLAGPFDYTPHLYQKGKSHCHGMAFFVVYQGPTTVVRGGIKEFASSGPNRFGPEAAFMRRVPMNWDETRVLDAKVGRHIVTARRSGATWFIGGMTGDAAYTAPVALDFLTPGKSYTATIFRDGEKEDGGFRPAVKETRAVKAGDRLDLPMAAAGGLAVIVE